MVKLDIFLIVLIVFMICSATLLFTIYYYNQEDKCNVDPLSYSAQYYLDRTTAEKVVGTLVLFQGFRIETINFNENGIMKKEKAGGNPPKNLSLLP